jgi:protoporphyrinogen oxidase
MRRRAFLATSAALAPALACRRRDYPFDGELRGPSLELGHIAREGRLPTPYTFDTAEVVIVGGGVAGLSAAWRLEGAGYQDYVLLELEPDVGGTSRSERNGVSAYPLAAHYVPAPPKDVRALVRLLEEAGVIEGRDAKGEPVYGEQHLVRSPEERIFYAGQWWEGLYLHAGESAEDQRQYHAFFREIDAWVAWRDAKGRKAFTLPRAQGSDAPEVRALDTLSFRAWLDARGFTSPRLRWLLDYACRDDYGARLETTSAFAGLLYFAARKTGPGEESRPLLTWPEGNGFLVNHLRGRVAERIRARTAVWRIQRDAAGLEVLAWQAGEHRPVGWKAKHVIFAGPMAMAGRLIPALKTARGEEHFKAFQASPWLVANLTLRSRPPEPGFPLAWDNVLRESAGLGYVVATHQSLRDHGPTVWTYYHALTGPDPRSEWMRLAAMGWKDVATLVMGDLGRAHPGLEAHVTRLDAMRWAHAMCRPRPGLLWSPDLELARRPFEGIHFAHHDLSGFALFEESQDHGLRAAEEVLGALGRRTETWR